MTGYLIVIYLISLAFGYVLAFTQTTLAIGRSLSDTGMGTGYQDAVTPPRFSTIAIVVYAVALGGVIYGFWAFGWLTGVAVAIGLLIAARLNMALFLPKINGVRQIRGVSCPRRPNIDPPCRLNIDPGTGAAVGTSGCG